MPTDRHDAHAPASTEAPSTTSESPARRPYRAPELRRLGSVRDLTLALSGMPGEAGGMRAM